MLAFTSALSARTIVVDQSGGGDYLTIKEGVNAARDGDDVLVNPGIYRESIIIRNKEIRILGSGPAATAIYSSTYYGINFGDDSKGSSIVGFSITSAGGTAVAVEQNAFPGISNCVLSGGGMGVQCVSYNGASVSNCVIIGCGGNAIHFEGATGLAVTNCIIIGNGGYGIFNGSGWYITSSYNNFWNNGQGNYGGQIDVIVIGSGNIEKDPQFVDPGVDFHLQEGSPCIDAGKPGFASLDPDGTRNDMGAYGGPYASMTGILGPIITELEVTPSIVKQGDQITIKAKGTIR